MKHPTQIWQHDAVGQAELIRSGQASAREVVQSAISRATGSRDSINALIHERFDAAIAEAAAIDDGSSPQVGQPFAGVPFVVKDLTCTTKGEPSTWGAQALVSAGRVGSATSELARRYFESGLVTIARSNLPEMAFGPPTTEPDAHGPCRNPWNLDLSVGGSSGGSAAAVAAGIVSAANGSDGGGSLRIPAACTGLIGLKVSRGRISNAPRAEGRGAGVQGHLARTVRDVAALLDVSSGGLPGEPFRLALPKRPFADSASNPIPTLRVGALDRAPKGADRVGDCGDQNRSALSEAVRLLSSLGHSVEAAHPEALDERVASLNLYAAERTALRASIEAELGRELAETDVEPRTWALFNMGARTTGIEVIEEIGREQMWTRKIATWWRSPENPRGFDLLLTPSIGRDVPLIGELKETAEEPLDTFVAGLPMAWFTYPFNISGNPAISIPVLAGPHGQPPISIQLVAAHGQEGLLLAVAQCFEDEVGWADVWPTLADQL